MKERVSTILTPNSNLPYRACGNTTRQVDFAIQELFKGNIVLVQDHYMNGNDKDNNRRLLNLIRDRLSFEHKGLKEIEIAIKFIRNTYTIELIK